MANEELQTGNAATIKDGSMNTNWQVSSFLETLFAGSNTNPFVGLRPFETNEGHLFFGRDIQVKDLLEKLHSRHFLAIVGSSGCGKSSLIKAGLIPKLKGGFLTNDRDHWLVAKMRPSGSPLQCLSEALRTAFDSDQSDIQKPAIDLSPESVVEMGASGFVEKMRNAFKDARFNLLILVDQFEELFTYEVNTEMQRNENIYFVNLLLSLANEKSLPVYTIITMRSDYIGHCNRFFGLPEVLNEAQYLVPRLKWQQIREVIEFPVKLYNQQINPGLLDLLTNDSDKDLDQLPVLQHCLMRMYANWSDDGKRGPIEFRHYEATGGLNGSICKHANEVYNQLDGKQQQIAEYLFKAITDFNAQHEPVRRPQKFATVKAICLAVKNSTEDDVLQVINKFRDKNCAFLTPHEDIKEITDNSVIDISHESLMRQWDRLKGDVSKGDEKNGWMKKEQRSADKLYWLSENVVDKREYLRGWDIKSALKWMEKQNPNEEWARRYVDNLNDVKVYIKKSITNNRKRNYLVYGSICLGMLGIILAISSVTIAAKSRLETEKKTALAKLEIEKTELAKSAEITKTKALLEIQKAEAQATRAKALLDVHTAEAKAKQAKVIAYINAKNAIDKAAAREKSQEEARKQILALTHESFYQSGLIPQSEKDAYIYRLIQLKYGEVSDTVQFNNLLSDLNNAVKILNAARTDPNKSLSLARKTYEFSKSTLIDSVLKEVANNYLFYVQEVNLDVKYNSARKVLSAISKDKNHFAIKVGDTIKIGSIDNGTIVWNSKKISVEPLETGYQSKVGAAEENITPNLIFTDDNYIMYLSHNIIYKWDLNGNQKGQPIPVPELADTRQYITALSPDGKKLAFNDGDFNVKIWNIETGSSLSTPPLNKNDGYVKSVRFSPDSRKLMTQQYSRFKFFGSSDLKPITTYPANFQGKVSYANFTSGDYVISVINDTLISIYDSSGKLVSYIKNPLKQEEIVNIDISPDWKKLLLKTSNFTLLSLSDIYYVTRQNSKDSLFNLDTGKTISGINLKQVVPATNTHFDLVTGNDLLGIRPDFNKIQVRLWKNYPKLSSSKNVTAMISDMVARNVGKKLEEGLTNVNNLTENELDSAAEYFFEQFVFDRDNYILKSICNRLIKINEEKYLDKYRQICLDYFDINRDTAQYIRESIYITAATERILNSPNREYGEASILKYRLAYDYGDLAWYSLFQKNADYKAIQTYAQKGIAFDSAQDWIYTNLVLAYLLDEQFDKAEAIYMQFRNRRKVYDGKPFKNAFLNDLIALENARIITPDKRKIHDEVTKIRSMLNAIKPEDIKE